MERENALCLMSSNFRLANKMCTHSVNTFCNFSAHFVNCLGKALSHKNLPEFEWCEYHYISTERKAVIQVELYQGFMDLTGLKTWQFFSRMFVTPNKI